MLDIKCYRGMVTEDWITNGIWAINRTKIKEMINGKIFKKSAFSKIIDILPGYYDNNFKERTGDAPNENMERMIKNSTQGVGHELISTSYGICRNDNWYNVLEVKLSEKTKSYVLYNNKYGDLFPGESPGIIINCYGVEPSKRPICLYHGRLYAIVMPVTISKEEIMDIQMLDDYFKKEEE